jgi:hypothetical protein
VAQLPWLDIAELAFQAGFRGEPHAIVVALAQPESNRNPQAVNPTDPNGGSYGLLQVNGAADPDAAGTYPNLVPTEAWKQRMFDPAENLKAAYQIWLSNSQGEKNFKPWGAYTSNLHLASLDAARAAMDGAARLRQANARVAQFKAERDRILVAHDALKITVELLKQKIADARQALA